MAYQIEKSFRNVVRNCEQKLMREDKDSFDSVLFYNKRIENAIMTND